MRALAGVLVALGLLAGVEQALRWAGVTPAYRPEHLAAWRMQPDMQDHRIQGNKEPHDFRLSTNADGLRTQLPRATREDSWRVAIMGDSIPFGWGVDDGQTLADGIAGALDPGTTGGSARVEVLNAAQPGYSTTQVSWLFQQVIQEFRPDLTVVFLSMHDHNLVLVSDLEYLQGPAGPMAAIRVGLARHSRTYEVLRRWLFPLSERSHVMPEEGGMEPRVPRVSDDERASNLVQMESLASAWGGRVLLGLLPFHGDLTAPHGSLRERVGAAWAAEFASSRGQRVVDIRDCCGPDGADLVLPFDHGHYSVEGNRRIGEALALDLSALRDQGTSPAP